MVRMPAIHMQTHGPVGTQLAPTGHAWHARWMMDDAPPAVGDDNVMRGCAMPFLSNPTAHSHALLGRGRWQVGQASSCVLYLLGVTRGKCDLDVFGVCVRVGNFKREAELPAIVIRTHLYHVGHAVLSDGGSKRIKLYAVFPL